MSPKVVLSMTFEFRSKQSYTQVACTVSLIALILTFKLEDLGHSLTHSLNHQPVFEQTTSICFPSTMTKLKFCKLQQTIGLHSSCVHKFGNTNLHQTSLQSSWQEQMWATQSLAPIWTTPCSQVRQFRGALWFSTGKWTTSTIATWCQESVVWAVAIITSDPM